jgi:hypothetical protein
MTTFSNTHQVALESRPGQSQFELHSQPLGRPRPSEPISVWALLKNALKQREDGLTGDSQFDESYLATRPAPLAPASTLPTEIQRDRRSIPLREQQAQRKQQNAMQIIERDQPQIHAMIHSMWGRQACSDYIQSLIMNGGDGMNPDACRLKVETVAALLALDGLHDAHLGQLRDAAGFGRQPAGHLSKPAGYPSPLQNQ